MNEKSSELEIAVSQSGLKLDGESRIDLAHYQQVVAQCNCSISNSDSEDLCSQIAIKLQKALLLATKSPLVIHSDNILHKAHYKEIVSNLFDACRTGGIVGDC